MGYEVKLHVGRVADFGSGTEEDGKWFSVSAMVDLHKPGYDSQIGMLCDKGDHYGTPIYMYGMDGNLKFTKDPYDKRLKAIPVADAIKALEDDYKANKNYRPFKVALSVLKAFNDGNSSVVLFGY